MTAATLALLAAMGLAQAQPSQPAQPTNPAPAKPATTKPAQPEPTLDDLLGIPKAKPAPAKPAPPTTEPAPSADPTAPAPTETPKVDPIDPTKIDLQRQLTPGEVKQLFDQAVETMDQTAIRLTSARDTGIDTQRLQEDVIRKLDTLIDEAKKQQSRSKKSKPKPQEQQDPSSQPQQSSQQSAKAGNEPNEGPGPAKVEGGLNAAPGGTAAWGNLPAHIRDALSQGKNEEYSSLYKLLTEKYYKRLAEEPRPGDFAPAPTPTPAPRPAPNQP